MNCSKSKQFHVLLWAMQGIPFTRLMTGTHDWQCWSHDYDLCAVCTPLENVIDCETMDELQYVPRSDGRIEMISGRTKVSEAAFHKAQCLRVPKIDEGVCTISSWDDTSTARCEVVDEEILSRSTTF